MPRAMWRGAIQFGLVTIPVRLYLATESRGGISFNMLHAEDLKRIQMKVHCPEHGEIKRSDTVRGFEWSKGQYVVLEDSDFEAVPLKTVRSIEIEQFVPARREDPGARFVKGSYYLEPEPVGRKAFGLLKRVLADSDLQAICKIVLKDREVLASLDPFGNTMLLSTLYWPDEVRDAGDLDIPEEDEAYKPAEVEMARQLVEALTGEFDASRYRDEYREALLKVIDSKVAGQPVEAPSPEPEASKLTDLMAVLEASVAAARSEQAAAPAEATAVQEPVSVDKARTSRSRKKAAAKPASKATSAQKSKRSGKAAAKSSPASRKRKTA
ncbi:MAG: Ku protein [Candidatus Limnocylindrales bacterium]